MFRIKVETDCYPGKTTQFIDLHHATREIAERVAEEARGSGHNVTATVIEETKAVETLVGFLTGEPA